jgi:hypothetical protein
VNSVNAVLVDEHDRYETALRDLEKSSRYIAQIPDVRDVGYTYPQDDHYDIAPIQKESYPSFTPVSLPYYGYCSYETRHLLYDFLCKCVDHTHMDIFHSTLSHTHTNILSVA